MMTRGMKDVIATKIHLTGIFNMPLTYISFFCTVKVRVSKCPPPSMLILRSSFQAASSDSECIELRFSAEHGQCNIDP